MNELSADVIDEINEVIQSDDDDDEGSGVSGN